jgi:hypothetical protein
MSQQALFELVAESATQHCPEAETDASLSHMRDTKPQRRLATLAKRIQQVTDPIDRARCAAELRDLAEALVATSVREANRAGLTWREIGAELGIPFQTLNRRYGEGS